MARLGEHVSSRTASRVSLSAGWLFTTGFSGIVVASVDLVWSVTRTSSRFGASMDLYPCREDGGRAVGESVAFLRDLERLLTTERRNEIRALLANGDATASTRWVRELWFHRQQ